MLDPHLLALLADSLAAAPVVNVPPAQVHVKAYPTEIEETFERDDDRV